MAGTRGRRSPRRRLKGWFKWLPFLLVPFGLLFAETYLRTQRLNNDYEINALGNEIEKALATIDSLKTKRAAMESLNLIDARAPELGFVEPGANQIESVGAPADSREMEDESDELTALDLR